MKRKCWTIAFFLLLLCMAGMLTAGAAEAEEVVAAQLPTPVLTSAAVYGDSVQLCWEAVEGAEVYRVFRMDSKKMWRSIGDGYDGVYWDDEVESGNTYTYTVRCLNRAGTAYTSGFDGKGVSVKYIAPAEITDARSTDRGVKLSWKAVKGAEKYVVQSYGYAGIGDVLATTTATTFTDTNVTSGKAYGYLVKTADKNGDIFCKSVVEPQEFAYVLYVATPQITRCESTVDGVKISWSQADGAACYRVFYKGKSGWKGMGYSASTEFIDAEVRDGGTYTYTVRAVDAYGDYCSDYNAQGYVYTYRRPTLAAPQVSGIVSTVDGVKLSWSKVDGAAAYRVFYKGKNGWKGMGNTAATSFIDTDIRDGGTYVYTVRCLNKAGEFCSGYNADGWTFTYRKPQPDAPQVTKLESTTEGVRISWKKIDNVYGYRVFYKGKSGWKGMGNTTATSFIDTDVRDGGTYTYTVRCVDSKGSFCSGYNPDGWVYTFRMPWLETPQISSLKNTGDGVEIRWGRVDGAAQYRVFRKNGGSWQRLADITSASYTDKSVTSGKTYTYTVRALSRSGNLFTSRYDPDGKTIRYIDVATDFAEKLLARESNWTSGTYTPENRRVCFIDLDGDGVNEFVVTDVTAANDVINTVYVYNGGAVKKVMNRDGVFHGLILLSLSDNASGQYTHMNLLTKTRDFSEETISADAAVVLFHFDGSRITEEMRAGYSYENLLYDRACTYTRIEGSCEDWLNGTAAVTPITEEAFIALTDPASIAENAAVYYPVTRDVYSWNSVPAAEKKQLLIDSYKNFSMVDIDWE